MKLFDASVDLPREYLPHADREFDSLGETVPVTLAESDRCAADWTATNWTPMRACYPCRRSFRFPSSCGQVAPLRMGCRSDCGSFSCHRFVLQFACGSFFCHRFVLPSWVRQIDPTRVGFPIMPWQVDRDRAGRQLGMGSRSRFDWGTSLRKACTSQSKWAIRHVAAGTVEHGSAMSTLPDEYVSGRFVVRLRPPIALGTFQSAARDLIMPGLMQRDTR